MATLLDLAVKVGLQDEVTGKIGGIASTIKNGLGKAAKVAGAAMGAMTVAAAGGLAVLGKTALDAYASYEQLVGGVDKLFGNAGQSFEDFAASASDSMYEIGQSGDDIKKLQEELIAAGYNIGDWGADGIYGPETKAAFEQYARDGGALVKEAYENSNRAADILKQNAQEAYKTAGLDANSYMEQATSFSASLIQSLDGDTVAAAEAADQAIRDMSDNVNTFGTDIGLVQNAYQGFAKGNFTMLDNLKLGYGGTQAEMQRLIDDANAVKVANGEMADLSIDSFADMVEAIHLVQEQQNIAGTTAREAATTIEGSLNMTKAAWQNLLIEMGKEDGDITQRVVEVVDSAATYLAGAVDENGNQISSGVIGRVATIFTGVAKAIPKAIPIVKSALKRVIPTLTNAIKDVGPAFGETIEELVANRITRIPELIASLLPDVMSVLPKVMEVGTKLFTGLVDSASRVIPEVISRLQESASSIVNTLMTSGPDVLQAAKGMFANIKSGIVDAWPEIRDSLGEKLENIKSKVADEGPHLLEKAKGLFENIKSGLLDKKDDVLGGLTELFSSIAQDFATSGPAMLETAKGFFSNLVTGAIERKTELINALGELIGGLGPVIETAIPVLLSMAGDLFSQMVTAATEALPDLTDAAGELIATIGSVVGSALPGMLHAGSELFGQIVTAITDALPNITESLGEIIASIAGQIATWGPGMLASAGEFIGNLAAAILEALPDVLEALGNIIFEIAGAIATAGPGMLAGAGEFIANFVTAVGDALPDVAAKMLEILADIGTKIIDAGPSILTWAGDMIANLVDAIINIGGEVGSSIFEVLGVIGSKIIEAGPSILSWAADMIANLPKAIGDAIFGEGGVAEKVGEVISNIQSPIEGLDLFSIGESVMQTLLNGLKSLAEDVWSFINEIGEGLASIGQGAAQGIDGTLGAIADSSEGLMESAANYFPSSPAKKGPFSGRGWTLYRGQAIVNGLVEGMDMAAASAERSTSSLMGGIYDSMSGTVNVGYANTDNSPVLQMLASIRDNIGNDIYLDGTTLVGGIAPGMNTALGLM